MKRILTPLMILLSFCVLGQTKLYNATETQYIRLSKPNNSGAINGEPVNKKTAIVIVDSNFRFMVEVYYTYPLIDSIKYKGVIIK